MAEDTAIDEPNWDLFRADLRVPKMTINRPCPSLDFDIPIRKRPRLLGPGDGPPPPRIDLQLVHDSNAFITNKIILPSGPFVERGDPRQRRAYYIIGWPDLPAARPVIDCAKALEYVSPRTLEDWEYQAFLRKEAERDEAEREVKEAAANTAASAQAKGRAIGPGFQAISQMKKKKRPGRPSKHQMMFMEGSPPTPQLNSEQEEQLAKRKHGPSLSTPQKGKIAQLDAEMHILETLGESMDDDNEEAKEEAEAVIQRQLEAELLRRATFPGRASDVADSDIMDSPRSTTPVTSQHQSPGGASATPSRRGQAVLPSRADPVVQGSATLSKSSPHPHSTNLARSPVSLPPHRTVITPLSKAVSSAPILPPRIPQPSQGNPSSSQTSAHRSVFPSVERTVVSIPKEPAPSPAPQGYSGFTTTNNFTPVGESFPRPLKRPADEALPLSGSNGASHPHKPQNNNERHTKTPKLDHRHHDHDDEPFESEEIHAAAQEPEDENQEYVVKRLEDDQILDGVHWFQVRWEGVWPEGQNPTWEPRDNIPANLVKQYLKHKAKKAAQAKEQQKQKKTKKSAAPHSSASKNAGGSIIPPPTVPELHKRQSTLEQWARTYSNVSEAFESPAELYDNAVMGSGTARTTTKKENHNKHNHQFGNRRVDTQADTDFDMAIVDDDEDDEADELFIVDSKRSAQELAEAEKERKRSLGSQFAAQFGRRIEF